MSLEERNKQAAEDFFAALNRGDAAAIVGAYSEDGYCHTMGNTLISGKFTRAQIAGAAGAIFQAFPKGIRFAIKTLTAEGDRVAVEAESEGMHASGKLYSNQYHFLLRFSDGKLLLFREYMDTERVTDILCGGQRPAGSA